MGIPRVRLQSGDGAHVDDAPAARPRMLQHRRDAQVVEAAQIDGEIAVPGLVADLQQGNGDRCRRC